MAQTLTGMNVIKSSKNGKLFMMLNLVDDTYMDSAKHATQLELFSNPEKTGWGQKVLTEFLDLEDIGRVEIIGDLVPGCSVRLFKENINGMDKITLIKVIDGKKK